jgi:hypothetical protein
MATLQPQIKEKAPIGSAMVLETAHAGHGKSASSAPSLPNATPVGVAAGASLTTKRSHHFLEKNSLFYVEVSTPRAISVSR